MLDYFTLAKMDVVLEEIEELLKKINYNKFLYYFKNGEGCISDAEYDSLVLRFKRLIATRESFKDRYGNFINLPTFKTDLPVVRHGKQILSLDNLYSYEELTRWCKYLNRITGLNRIEFFLTPKIDGLFINLIYVGGRLKKVLTRYDGICGEDITITAMQLKNIPKSLKNFTGDVEIHGELYLRKSNYALILIESLRKAYDELTNILKNITQLYCCYISHIGNTKLLLEICGAKDYSTPHIRNTLKSWMAKALEMSVEYENIYKTLILKRSAAFRKLKGVNNMRNMASGIARANIFNLMIGFKDYLYSFRIMCREMRNVKDMLIYLDKIIERSGEILKRIDGTAKYKNLLSFLPHGVGASSIDIDTLESFHKFTKENGFSTIPKQYKTEQINSVYRYVDNYNNDEFDFESDGIVIATNSLSLQRAMGSTGNSPRGMRSYKLQPDARKSRIEKILFHMGRTGVLTPVALIDTIKDYQNANITHVTLHNFSFLKEKRILPGDSIMVIRSGNVIPKIVKHIPSDTDISKTQRYLVKPSRCYACKGDLHDDGTYLRCENRDCKGRLLAYLEYVCARKLLNINVGHSTLKYLVTCNICRNLYDLINLKYEDIKYIIGKNGYIFSNRDKNGALFISKTARLFLRSIEEAKKITLKQALLLLNIPALGHESAEQISQIISSTTELQNLDVTRIHGIGEELKGYIKNWLKSDKNLLLLRYLDSITTKTEREVFEKKKRICISGKLSLTRGEFKKRYKKYEFVDHITKTVDYLLLGEMNDTSAKYRFAKKHKIPIIGEDEIQRLEEI